MSCRDLRNFTETMRFLGYPRLISLSNFRVPNFTLVAEILVWLIHRFDPDSEMTADCESVDDRVSLIRRAAEFIAIKTNIKLNTKKLYQADGHAVHELLKIATALYDAQNKSAEDDIMSGEIRSSVVDISDQLTELKSTRQMASQLTVSGATLFDLLGREVQLREIRNNKVARQYDTSTIEVALKEVIEGMKREIDETKKQIDNVKETEQTLDTKIERRRVELDRNEKRLRTLRKVRPAFMEEFEKLEVELRVVYDDYLQKCRYLAYLEHLYEVSAKVEQEKFEQRQAATKRQLEQIRDFDADFNDIIDRNDSLFTDNLRGSINIDDTEKVLKNDKTRIQTAKREPTGRGSRVPASQARIRYGTMSGNARGASRDASNDSNSSDSEFYDLVDGDVDYVDDDDDDNDDDDAIEVVRDNRLNTGVSREMTAIHSLMGKTEKRSTSKMEHIDEDF